MISKQFWEEFVMLEIVKTLLVLHISVLKEVYWKT